MDQDPRNQVLQGRFLRALGEAIDLETQLLAASQQIEKLTKENEALAKRVSDLEKPTPIPTEKVG